MTGHTRYICGKDNFNEAVLRYGPEHSVDVEEHVQFSVAPEKGWYRFGQVLLSVIAGTRLSIKVCFDLTISEVRLQIAKYASLDYDTESFVYHHFVSSRLSMAFSDMMAMRLQIGELVIHGASFKTRIPRFWDIEQGRIEYIWEDGWDTVSNMTRLPRMYEILVKMPHNIPWTIVNVPEAEVQNIKAHWAYTTYPKFFANVTFVHEDPVAECGICATTAVIRELSFIERDDLDHVEPPPRPEGDEWSNDEERGDEENSGGTREATEDGSPDDWGLAYAAGTSPSQQAGGGDGLLRIKGSGETYGLADVEKEFKRDDRPSINEGTAMDGSSEIERAGADGSSNNPQTSLAVCSSPKPDSGREARSLFRQEK
jgi:hypothetical protein